MQLISCQKSATRVNHSFYFKASRDMDGGTVLKILPEILRQPFNVVKFLNFGLYPIESIRTEDVKARWKQSGASTMPTDRMIRSTRGNTANARR